MTAHKQFAGQWTGMQKELEPGADLLDMDEWWQWKAETVPL
jgi:hypothetical protein